MMTEVREKRFLEMPFIEFLRAIKEEIEGIYYRKDSHDAYHEAYKIAKLFERRYITEYHLGWHDQYLTQSAQYCKTDIQLLERYDFKSRTYKAKEEAINEFKKEFLIDLKSFIWELEREQNKEAVA